MGIGSSRPEYWIHDNRARPYCVYDFGTRIEVHNANATQQLVGKIMDIKYEKIFVGDDDPRSDEYKAGYGLGNSILVLQANGKCVYIGDGIREFKPLDSIVEYHSPIGNNDVPYPYAVGTKYIYHMIENMYFPIKDVDTTRSINDQLYDWDKKGFASLDLKSIRMKILFKREELQGGRKKRVVRKRRVKPIVRCRPQGS